MPWFPNNILYEPTVFNLFLGYTDNSVQYPSNNEMVLFADDTKMFLNVESNYGIDCFQKDIESVCDWATDWSLSFNAKKMQNFATWDKCQVHTDYIDIHPTINVIIF